MTQIEVPVSVIGILILLLIIGALPKAYAQEEESYSLVGTVKSAQTGLPLADVHVYLSGSSHGGATDQQGKFSFKTSLTGSQVLVASSIGYKAQNQRVLVGNSSSQIIVFQLEESIYEMAEIHVTGSNKKWEEQYKDFERFFLGDDSFAESVYIENPEVLNFEPGENSSELIAEAREPLVIRNESLGYHMEVELKQVQFNTRDNTGLYTVYPVFSFLKSTDGEATESWKKNREEAYKGSARHFFKSLYHDRIRSNDFDYSPDWGLEEVDEEESRKILHSLNLAEFEDVYKVFRFRDNQVAVGYDLNIDLDDGQLSPREVSYIAPNGTQEHFLINSRGQLFNPISIIFYGPWAQERIARLLPAEFAMD